MSQLEQAKGAKYAGVTQTCLESSFLPPHSRDSEVLESNAALYEASKRLVVDRIGMCKV